MTAFLCPNCGPYHVARLRALSHLAPGRLRILEIADSERLYPWTSETEGLPMRTLFAQPYEDLKPGNVARKAIAEVSDCGAEVVFVHGYATPDMRSLARWARRAGLTVLTCFDSCVGDRRRHWLKERLKRWFVERTFDGAFASGSRSVEYAQSLGIPANRIVTGYDVVDNEFFAAGAEEVRRAGVRRHGDTALPERFFLYVGRFSAEKNLQELIRAYAAYRGCAAEPWGLALVGSGPGEAGLRAEAEAVGPEGIIWIPFQPPEGLVRLYGLASCFVLPSRSEPWGLVVNEAMAAGLPVLVSEMCGCAPELVREGGNGYTFPPGDGEALASLMARVADGGVEARAAMGETSRRLVSAYTPETWAARAVDLIRRTHTPRPRGAARA